MLGSAFFHGFYPGVFPCLGFFLSLLLLFANLFSWLFLVLHSLAFLACFFCRLLRNLTSSFVDLFSAVEYEKFNNCFINWRQFNFSVSFSVALQRSVIGNRAQPTQTIRKQNYERPKLVHSRFTVCSFLPRVFLRVIVISSFFWLAIISTLILNSWHRIEIRSFPYILALNAVCAR